MMARAKDLDLVAADDVVETKNESPVVKNVTINKIIKLTDSKDGEIRQKVYDVLGHTLHSLSSFLVRPHVFNFAEKDEEEEIILVMRPHWFTNVSWVITTIFMLMVPSLTKYIPIWNGIAFRYQLLGILFWYMITLAFSLEKFLSWYFDVYIITDERVIDIEFNNLLDKKFAEAKMSMIQDVSSRVAGISQTMFNYGDVRIQTAAEIPELMFEKVPNPDKVIKVLQLMRQEEEQEAIDGRMK